MHKEMEVNNDASARVQVRTHLIHTGHPCVVKQIHLQYFKPGDDVRVVPNRRNFS